MIRFQEAQVALGKAAARFVRAEEIFDASCGLSEGHTSVSIKTAKKDCEAAEADLRMAAMAYVGECRRVGGQSG